MVVGSGGTSCIPIQEHSMSFLSTLAGVLPFVGSIVQGIEALFGHGNGAQKKSAAISAVQAGLGAYGAVTGADVSSSSLPADLGALIDAAVAVYNDLGIFTHSAGTASTPGVSGSSSASTASANTATPAPAGK